MTSQRGSQTVWWSKYYRPRSACQSGGTEGKAEKSPKINHVQGAIRKVSALSVTTAKPRNFVQFRAATAVAPVARATPKFPLCHQHNLPAISRPRQGSRPSSVWPSTNMSSLPAPTTTSFSATLTAAFLGHSRVLNQICEDLLSVCLGSSANVTTVIANSYNEDNPINRGRAVEHR